MRLKAIPRSRAKTAWGLCLDVKRAILAEPKRAWMGCYNAPMSPDQGGPACGTIGCFAGWVCNLRGQVGGDDVDARAILGDAVDYNFRTRTGNLRFYFNSGAGDMCGRTKYGTPAHARAVAKRIDRFMAQNAAALKARKLPPVGTGR